MPAEGMGHFDFIYTADVVRFHAGQQNFSPLSHTSAYHFRNSCFHSDLLKSILVHWWAWICQSLQVIHSPIHTIKVKGLRKWIDWASTPRHVHCRLKILVQEILIMWTKMVWAFSVLLNLKNAQQFFSILWGKKLVNPPPPPIEISDNYVYCTDSW